MRRGREAGGPRRPGGGGSGLYIYRGKGRRLGNGSDSEGDRDARPRPSRLVEPRRPRTPPNRGQSPPSPPLAASSLPAPDDQLANDAELARDLQRQLDEETALRLAQRYGSAPGRAPEPASPQGASPPEAAAAALSDAEESNGSPVESNSTHQIGEDEQLARLLFQEDVERLRHQRRRREARERAERERVERERAERAERAERERRRHHEAGAPAGSGGRRGSRNRHAAPAAAGHRRHQDVDVDNMTYEQLLELGEEIGEVKDRGIRGCALQSRSAEIDIPEEGEPPDPPDCVICTDPLAGTKGRLLPCAHVFHVECIDRWLDSNAMCPICRERVSGE
eukprot:Hpha_TRINITY_DN15571_c2_g4::TRINITY_DN15571_c2_g4_i1::g.106246::m.106246